MPTRSPASRAAFRSGFLGVPSLGWSTLVQIVEASEADRAALVETLAREQERSSARPISRRRERRRKRRSRSWLRSAISPRP